MAREKKAETTSENPGLCVTLPRQNAHLPSVNSAFVPVASLDSGVFGGCPDIVSSTMKKGNVTGFINQTFLKKSIPVFRVRRQAGFSLIEMAITLAIIAILTGIAVFSIRATLPGMRANQAMYQVVESLRDARMLAMSQNRMVSMQFTAENAITVLIRNDAGAFVPVSDMMQLAYDPSTILGNRYAFIMDSTLGDTPDAFGAGGVIVFGGAGVVPGTPPDRTFVFTTDGFLTENSDLHQPISGTIFIGLPGGGERLMRAVTILGATGRIRSYQWRNSGWRPVR